MSAARRDGAQLQAIILVTTLVMLSVWLLQGSAAAGGGTIDSRHTPSTGNSLRAKALFTSIP